MQKPNINPLLCNIETGMCEIPEDKSGTSASPDIAGKKPVKVVYYTDPICSSCWGIEPQLRKLKLEYGDFIEFEYRMGGLLPDWSYNSGGISKPSDVAHHWDEVSEHYDMPIDGDVWLEDPLHSSYPPSIAFKAAQIQDNYKAILFLRGLRELVFLEKKNITKWDNIEIAAKKAGLNLTLLKSDYEGKAKELFKEDLDLGRNLGVRGFPTMFFINGEGIQERVNGIKTYNFYADIILKLWPGAAKRFTDTSWKGLFTSYVTLTSREFAELSGIARKEADSYLQNLSDEGHLEKQEIKNGILWKIKAVR